MEYLHHYASPLGGVTLASDGETLTALRFDGQRCFAAAPAEALEERKLPVFTMADRWLDIYFSGRAPDFTPPLRLRGSDFRVLVWETLLTIPYGDVVTYGKIADMIAEKRGLARMSARAVGAAAGRNPLLLIVPCHRVLGSNGSLTGYAAGLDRKRSLLELERAAMSKLKEKQPCK